MPDDLQIGDAPPAFALMGVLEHELLVPSFAQTCLHCAPYPRYHILPLNQAKMRHSTILPPPRHLIFLSPVSLLGASPRPRTPVSVSAPRLRSPQLASCPMAPLRVVSAAAGDAARALLQEQAGVRWRGMHWRLMNRDPAVGCEGRAG